jgi:hypothetical protein
MQPGRNRDAVTVELVAVGRAPLVAWVMWGGVSQEQTGSASLDKPRPTTSDQRRTAVGMGKKTETRMCLTSILLLVGTKIRPLELWKYLGE